MRIKALIIILIALITLITAFVGVKQPTLHKQAMFSDEYHRFVEEELPTADITLSNVQAPAQRPVSVQEQKPQTVNKPTFVQKTEPKKYVEQKPQVKKEVSTPKPKQDIKQETPVQKPKQEVQPPKAQTPHQLTEQEEIIAWNKWRSNLQNQVMKDAPTRAPLGTVFKFSFTVDKYGNMSNIKVWSETPAYTDLAVRVIKPVLTSYAHKPILNFPQGTKRVITNVTGGYKISTRTKYSSPSDYSDYEKVKRYY